MTSAPDTIRVLHVDDEPDFAELTADFLVRQDNRLVVETATSVAEGLNQLSDENFDCIVSDYDMPERNGIEFLETVREDYPEFPFILFTGKGSEEIASEAISAGVTDYLQKEGGTGQYSVLANRIINAVSRRRTERDLRASEQRYRQLLEAAPVPILLYSESLEVIHTNEAAVDFLNADDRGQLIGKHATEFAHPDNQDHVQSRLERIASTREPIPAAEAKIIAVDGSEKFAVASSIPGTYQGEPVVQTVAYDITQQKEQAGNYQAIFENTPEGIVLHDAADGSFVDMNTRYVEMFGYESNNEFLEAGFEAIHPNDPPYTLERAAEQVQKAITEGSHTFEWLAVRKDGSQFWAEVHLAPVELHGEERILAAVRDITERKEREDELREASRRLNLSLDATETGVWEWNMETDEVHWNESMERLLGIEPGSFDGTYEAHEEYLYPDDVETIEQATEEAIKGDESFDAEFRMVRRDGDIIWVRSRGEYFSEGGPERMIGTTTDITGRKERELEHVALTEELKQKTRHLDAIMEYTTRPLFMKAASGEYLLANREYQRIFDLSEDDIIGRTDFDLHSQELADQVWANDLQVLETEESIEIEERINVDGEERIYLSSKVPVYFDADSGDPDAVFGMATDITEREAREKELEQMNARLEEFASVVSHDLRNPLNVAEGRLELAQEEFDSEDLDAVARSLERMRLLIEDLLTLARDGEEVTDIEPVALSVLVERSWKNVETAQATLQFDADRSLLADMSRLQQLIENLVRNAVEHGGETVQITVGLLDNGFYIEDDGPGIPEAERNQVFDAGYSTSPTGTGFGLRIVEQVAQAHGWSIRATEGSDGGSRFEVTGVEFTES